MVVADWRQQQKSAELSSFLSSITGSPQHRHRLGPALEAALGALQVHLTVQGHQAWHHSLSQTQQRKLCAGFWDGAGQLLGPLRAQRCPLPFSLGAGGCAALCLHYQSHCMGLGPAQQNRCGHSAACTA